MHPGHLLTAFRLIAAAPIFVAIQEQAWIVALALFWFAVISDLLDGWWARRSGKASAWGGLFDHAVDAVFVSTALVGLAMGGPIPILLPALVLIAFIQYMLDSKALSGKQLRASFLGRWNGIAYYVLAAIPLTRDCFSIGWPSSQFVSVLAWCLVVSTLFSIFDRLRS